MREQTAYVSDRKDVTVRLRAGSVIIGEVAALEQNACSRTCLDAAIQDLKLPAVGRVTEKAGRFHWCPVEA